MDRAQRHHHVARMYLKAFLDPALVAKGRHQLWVYRPGQRPQAGGTKKVGAETLFYQMPELPEFKDAAEDWLAELETIAAPRLHKLRAGVLPLTAQEKGEFAGFVALSYARGPFFRNLVDAASTHSVRADIANLLAVPGALQRRLASIPEAHRERLVGPGVERVREALSSVINGDIDVVQTSRAWTVKAMFMFALSLMDLIERTRWVLLRAPKGHIFLTSDNPVIITDPGALVVTGQPMHSDQFQFAFPISRELLLVGVRRPGIDRVMDMSKKHLARANLDQIRMAQREVYASVCSDEIRAMVDRHLQDHSAQLAAALQRFDATLAARAGGASEKTRK